MTKKKPHTDQPEAEAANSFSTVPWVTTALLILSAAVAGGLYWSNNITISDVRFSGHHFVTTEELQKQIDIPTGIRPDSLNFMEIIGQIEQIPYVDNAEVNVEPSGKLHIRVTERKPIALLARGESKIYIDKDGLRLPLLLEKNVDVPVLYGFKTEPMSDTLQSDAFGAVRDFLLEMHSRTVSNATISEIAWTADQGIVALTNENGVKLIFGKEDFKTRLRNWEAFYGEIVKTKGIDRMQSVDLRFRGQIVTRET